MPQMQKMFRAATLSLVTAATVSACAATRDVTALPDVACVWAGRVRVKMLWLRPNGEAQPFEAALGEPTPLADGTITLESVHPDKRPDRPIKAGDYRFAFRFMGGL